MTAGAGGRRVLVVDDDPEFGDSLLDILDLHGYEAVTVRDAPAALEALPIFDPPVALLDIRLGGMSGVELISCLRTKRPELVCVVMTAHVDTPSAIEALRHGAYDYIDKACSPSELAAVLERAFERHQLSWEKRTAIEALHQAKEAAEAASHAKSSFLATVSHELRTPLNAIIGFSDLMLAATAGPVAKEPYRGYLKDINASGQHLLAIINDILDLTKAEAGKLELAEDLIQPEDAIAPVVRLVMPRITAASQTLAVEIDQELPLLRADERKTRQVLLNLLSNATKFTPAGGQVWVRASVDRTGGLAITVADTGIGIAAEHLTAVLEPFTQIDSSLSRRHEGTGLGLPLVKSFMELHGGTLRLDSTPGAGTTVTVTFPAERLVAREPVPPGC